MNMPKNTVIKRSAVAFLAVLTLGVFLLQPALAQDSAIGQRVFNDNRIPQTEVKKRIVIKDKYMRNVTVQPAGALGAEEKSAAQTAQDGGVDVSAKNNDLAAKDIQHADDQADESASKHKAAGLRELNTLTDEEQKQILEQMNNKADGAKENSPEQKAAEENVDQNNQNACVRACKLVDDPSCMDRCQSAGVCSLGFIDCEKR